MADKTEIRVGAPGTAKVRTIHVSALQSFLNKGFFRVDDSGAPVDAAGKPYKLDDRGDPIIPEPTEAELAEQAKIVRPPTDEFLAAQRAAEVAPDPKPSTSTTTTKPKEG